MRVLWYGMERRFLTETSEAAAGPIVAVILTKDEEDRIAKAIASIENVVDAIVVVDSESVDATCDIARSLGAHVVVRPFDSFCSQRNFALGIAISLYSPDWILSLDADEELSPPLREEIRELVRARPEGQDAYLIPLRVRFAGRVLRYGGFQRTVLLRLFRPSAGRYEDRDVNEHFVLSPGARIGQTRAPLIHADVRSWARHIEKHNRYSTLEAKARLRRLERGASLGLRTAVRYPHLRRRFLRERVWDHVPGHPLLRFIQIYFLGLGFLDGRAGFRAALFQAWQEMCIDCKYEELVVTRPTSTSTHREP